MLAPGGDARRRHIISQREPRFQAIIFETFFGEELVLVELGLLVVACARLRRRRAACLMAWRRRFLEDA